MWQKQQQEYLFTLVGMARYFDKTRRVPVEREIINVHDVFEI